MSSRVPQASGGRGGLVSGAAAGILLVGVMPAEAEMGATITVDSTSDVVDVAGTQTVADLPGPNGRTSLREATIAATNTAGPDRIVFDIPTSDPGFDGSTFTIDVDPASVAAQLTLGDAGTTLDGTTQPGGYPITVEGSSQAKADERVGLLIASSGNTVKGLGWQLYGSAIRITSGTDNLITGVTVRDCNNGVQLHEGFNALTESTITSNDRSPVTIVNSLGSTVSGNTITDNALTGVFVMSAPETRIADNFISGNETGISVANSDTRGGLATGNTITGNRSDGVRISNAGFSISQNSIYRNGGLGINLLAFPQDEFGVSRNTKGGPNYPDHLTAVTTGEATVVEGRVDYDTPQSVTLELFINDAADPSGHGEGHTFIGTATPDAKGRFTATLPGNLTGKHVTATATAQSGTTSEFSVAEPVTNDNRRGR